MKLHLMSLQGEFGDKVSMQFFLHEAILPKIHKAIVSHSSSKYTEIMNVKKASLWWNNPGDFKRQLYSASTVINWRYRLFPTLSPVLLQIAKIHRLIKSCTGLLDVVSASPCWDRQFCVLLEVRGRPSTVLCGWTLWTLYTERQQPIPSDDDINEFCHSSIGSLLKQPLQTLSTRHASPSARY